MNKKRIFIKELNNNIEHYILELEKITSSCNGKVVDWKLFTYLTIVSRTKNNLKGILNLINIIETDNFILLPINSIMRNISSDLLTFSYLSTFLSEVLNESQITFKNELDSLDTEYYFLLKDLNSNIEIPKYYLDKENIKIKKRKNFHINSDIKILGKDYKFSNNNFLTEKAKKDRIDYFVENKIGIYTLLKNENYEIFDYMISFYFSNKWFTQYYHYNSYNSKLSTSKKDEILIFELNQIKTCIVKSFLVLKIFHNILKPIV